ncbi:MAG: DUF1858 domain-containing protein [Candidatus Dojkabacteria bacterium]|jgi:hybrid cluster-associated redox disulfide protein|nr:DUF1858 domain-containing protein [Candidatus Dojkabacteria bacterium]
MKIKKNWTIQKLLDEYPSAAEILVEYGFHCIGCAIASMETIEQGAKVHGLDEQKLREMLEKIEKSNKDSENKD